MLSLSYDIRDRWGGWEDQQIKKQLLFSAQFRILSSSRRFWASLAFSFPCFSRPISSEPTQGLTKWYQSGDPPTAPPPQRHIPPSRPFLRPSEAKPVTNHATKNISFYDADVAPCLPGPDRYRALAAMARCCVLLPPPTLN
jgi:hypothetical protein